MASIREQLRELENPTPGSFDPEDSGSLTAAKLTKNREEEVESHEGHTPTTESINRFGTIRKRTKEPLITDYKYKGIKISRSELEDENLSSHKAVEGDEDEIDNGDDYDDSGEDDDSDAYISDCDVDNGSVQYNGFPEGEPKTLESVHKKIDVGDGIESEDEDDSAEEQSAKNQLQKLTEIDTLKGKAVSNQLGLWEKLLEIRIKLHRCVQLANKYPQGGRIKHFEKAGGPNIQKEKKDVKKSLVAVLDELLELQSKLLSRSNPITSQDGDTTGAGESDEEINSDSDIESHEKEAHKQSLDKPSIAAKMSIPTKKTITEFEKEISSRHCIFEKVVEETITKWDEKTKTSYGNKKNRNFASFDRSVIQQIKQILSEKERLVKRTQLKRSIYRTLGRQYQENSTEESAEDVDLHLKNYDPEIFDDDDFYHQLLKEFIERKSNVLTTDDPVSMGRQWLEIQKLRSKAKKKVDSKASKGRRIRYNVHSKLLNFMAPVSVGSMNDQARNDLFKSLFGGGGGQ